jgi:hypothetical protein
VFINSSLLSLLTLTHSESAADEPAYKQLFINSLLVAYSFRNLRLTLDHPRLMTEW